MPLIDMPLEELRAYRGLNECPADLDEFWDRSLQEMEALGADYELVPAEFQAPGAECFHLWFTGMGGARVHARFLRPAKREGKLPAVLMFHGYSGDSGSFASKLGYVGAGYVVAAMDCRGQGGLSEDPVPVKGNTLNGQIIRGLEDEPEKLYFRNVFLDAAQLARIVMSLSYVDETRVAATGGSQGGGLTLA
ncbi:MAG: acetylxylan esterase, partial [Clostridia bacterium]|nr:acetylxylan esterase [Clostridia bacterium]